ncbi:CPBP family intramembrane glutamic endopeptidase [Alishewanella longhuensis]
MKENSLLLLPLSFIPLIYLTKNLTGNDFPSCNDCILGVNAILLLLINVVILGPILEEVVFRQILPKLLSGNLRIPSLITAVICSASFSYIHLESFTLYLFSFYFTSGLCFHYIRFKTGSLFIVFLAHSLYNFVITVLIDITGML